MTSAELYFALMVLAMLPLTFVHFLCWRVVGLHPDIMPDDTQRARYRLSELAMGTACATMLWYMWMVLDYMVTFCATDPVAGMLAHIPWILGTSAVLITKTRHLYRLIEQVRAL